MQWLNSIDLIKNELWQNDYPFLSKGFLSALEQSKSINGQSGWDSHYLVTSSQSTLGQPSSNDNNLDNSIDSNASSCGSNDEIDMIIPAFIKHHSYGEYVFDWGWAEAYQNHGLDYYPKLVIAAPFTPAQGPRIFGPNTSELTPDQGKTISLAIQQHCKEHHLSGAHILLCNDQERAALQGNNWHIRSSVQFHWYNYGYNSFDHFLSTFKSRKRKAVNKERAFLRSQNITIQRILGKDITEEQWLFFNHCYQTTYEKRGMQGYINLNGFKNMQQEIPDSLFLVMAYQENTPVACALYFKDSENLYGRYWGCDKDIPGLHFEVCYYQGIEYCIENSIPHFDPGTQGEHKISRGFEPVFRYSLHHLQHEGFHHAVGDFVKQERYSLEHYQKECFERLPFNDEHMPHLKA